MQILKLNYIKSHTFLPLPPRCASQPFKRTSPRKQSRAEVGWEPCPSPSPSPPGLRTIKALFRTWPAAAFPTFDQGALKAIQCPCPARKPMGRAPLQAETRAPCPSICARARATYGLSIRLLIFFFFMSYHHPSKHNSSQEAKRTF